MKKVMITHGTAEDFFFRGKALARRLDRHEQVKAKDVAATITFEEIGDLLHALSPARLALIQAVKSEPGSITSLAQHLNLDRSAVTRDVELLRQLGILEVEDRPEAGHHRQKWVSPPCAAHEVGGTRVRDEASRRRERVAFRVAMAASH